MADASRCSPYDLIGLQSNQDRQHFESYVLGEAHGEALGDDNFRAYGQTVRCGAFPIGIDVNESMRSCARAKRRTCT
jgi:trehalose-6-phosphate synthase